MDKLTLGSGFERVAMEFFAKEEIVLSPDFTLDIGLLTKKKHRFDRGASDPKVIVECKCHRWTTGANVPSAKVKIWNEAMYYFHFTTGLPENTICAPRQEGEGRRESVELLPTDIQTFDPGRCRAFGMG